jgi:hypothetical protein
MKLNLRAQTLRSPNHDYCVELLRRHEDETTYAKNILRGLRRNAKEEDKILEKWRAQLDAAVAKVNEYKRRLA